MHEAAVGAVDVAPGVLEAGALVPGSDGALARPQPTAHTSTRVTPFTHGMCARLRSKAAAFP